MSLLNEKTRLNTYLYKLIYLSRIIESSANQVDQFTYMYVSPLIDNAYLKTKLMFWF